MLALAPPTYPSISVLKDSPFSSDVQYGNATGEREAGHEEF
jgi:hypothetical protein